MGKFEDKLTNYIKEILDIDLKPTIWDKTGILPPYLRKRYTVYSTSILNHRMLLILDTAADEQPPAVLCKHIQTLAEYWESDIVYVRDRVSSFNRKRLIKQAIPFIVPFNQLYLPFLGMDLREYYHAMIEQPILFAPATQAALIYMLYKTAADQSVFTPGQLALLLKYTPMTMTRAFNQIHAAGLGIIEKKGHERCMQFHEPKAAAWEKALPYLRSPVLNRVYIEKLDNMQSADIFKEGYSAGIEALAMYTDLARPGYRVLAAGKSVWTKLRTIIDQQEIPYRQPDSIELELWAYEPKSLENWSIEQSVDPLSLYLSLKDQSDERIEAALKQMMERIDWQPASIHSESTLTA